MRLACEGREFSPSSFKLKITESAAAQSGLFGAACYLSFEAEAEAEAAVPDPSIRQAPALPTKALPCPAPA